MIVLARRAIVSSVLVVVVAACSLEMGVEGAASQARAPEPDAGEHADGGAIANGTAPGSNPGDAGTTFDGAAGPAGPSGPAKPQSFSLTSAVGGAGLPFTVGLAFGKGDVPSTFALDALDAQVEVKRRWNDGSVKHAVVSGFVDLLKDVPKTITVVSGAPNAQAPLSCADIAQAAPQATVQLGSLGTVALSSLLSAPIRTWLAGPHVVECHYRGAVDADRRVTFHVRRYKTGATFVRAVVENGWLDRASDTSYVPTVTIGSATVLGGGGALSHYGRTRWVAEGVIGSDPKVVARHDTTALMATRLVPHYAIAMASNAALAGLPQTYVPMGRADWTASMGDTGYQEQIGLLPRWDALYLTSGGDPRALRASVVHSLSLGSYPIVWRDPNGDQIVLPSQRASWTVNGANGGGETVVSAGPLTWDVAHHGSAGYLAYLVTGDFVHLETMFLQASLAYLIDSVTHGQGTARVFGGQTRGAAWSLRTVGQVAAIAPADALTADYAALIAKNVASHDGRRAALASSTLGVLYSYELATGWNGAGQLPPWMQSFFVQTFGHLSDLEPVAVTEMATLHRVRDFLYRFPVGLLGAGGATEYCFTAASRYGLKVAPGTTDSLSSLYDWAQVAAENGASGACGNTLAGTSGGDPTQAWLGYWGNLLPAIAYAVDHGAPGAAAAWARLRGASNWSAVSGSGFDGAPQWGVLPRGSPP